MSHRDLKPENVLLKWSENDAKLREGTKSVVKIADLGAAKVLDKS